MITRGAQAFERFCWTRHIPCQRIPEAKPDGLKSPDYMVTLVSSWLIAEVKDIDPNEEDLKWQEDLISRGWSMRSTKPGRRVFRKIGKAARQLKPWTKQDIPTLIVLFDNTHGHYLDPYHIKTAMYGLDAMMLAVPKGVAERPRSTGWASGGGSAMTYQDNTSVSAVAALRSDEEDVPYLVVYHNCYAAVPLDVSCLTQLTDHQYILARKRPEGIDEWVRAR